jgi:hypothetical protein
MFCIAAQQKQCEALEGCCRDHQLAVAHHPQLSGVPLQGDMWEDPPCLEGDVARTYPGMVPSVDLGV